jgi:hypothetical protein
MDYYKVVTHDMRSLGLRRNPNIMLFTVGIWKHEPSPKEDKKDSGGIWVANGKGNAHSLEKYMLTKGIKTRTFRVEIGKVLYSNSYRTKTSKVKLLYEILN